MYLKINSELIRIRKCKNEASHDQTSHDQRSNDILTGKCHYFQRHCEVNLARFQMLSLANHGKLIQFFSKCQFSG